MAAFCVAVSFTFGFRIKTMKTLIVYKSQHGTTAKAARYLQDRLGAEHTDMLELTNGLPENFSEYHKILIGGSIHAGEHSAED